VGRPWLKTKPAAMGFFSWIEPVEIALFRKSETILMGRLLSFGAGIVTLYDVVAVWASSLDLTPVTTRLFDAVHVPVDMRGVVWSGFVALLGLLMTWLRKRTTMPVELVAIPDKLVTPRVAEAIAMADQTKTEAVNVVAGVTGAKT